MSAIGLPPTSAREPAGKDHGDPRRSRRRPGEAFDELCTIDPLPLVPSGLSVLPFGVTTAAVAQQWRYSFFRSPKAIQTLIIPPAMGIMVAHSAFSGSGVAAQSAAFAALAVVVGSFNLLGHDRAGVRYLVAPGHLYRK